MTSFTSSNYLDIHLNKLISQEEFKNIIYCGSLLDNIHDFKENIDFENLKITMNSNNLINQSKSDLICNITDEDKYLENVIGLKRYDNGHWTSNLENNLPTKGILSEYTFINYDNATNKNPIETAIQMIFKSVKTNKAIEESTEKVPYRNIELVVDTQKGLFDAINDYTHYFNWMDCVATRIDPAGKSNPKTKKDKLSKDPNDINKVYYTSVQEVLEIPNYNNNQYPNVGIEENNTILFSSNCDITLYTGENSKAYALINPNESTGKHAKNKYAVPHTFLQKSDKKPQTIKMLKKLLKNLFKTITGSKKFKQIKKKETQANKYTDMHYLMKRFGDAIQALYCGYLQKENKIPWLVTYDRPLLGHAILYKTPVIVYCNHYRNKDVPGSGLTIAIHNSVLSDDAKTQLEEKLKKEKEKQQLIINNERKELESIKSTNTTFINKQIEIIIKLFDTLDIGSFNTNTFDNETYKDFLKFLYINFYKNEKYEFIKSLTLLLNDVHNKNIEIDINNHITHQNIIDKRRSKINKLITKINTYVFKDKINNPDRLKMILRGLRTKLGKYKTIVPEGRGRRAMTNIGGKTFLIQTKNKILKMIQGINIVPLLNKLNKLNSVISLIDKAINQLDDILQSGGNGDKEERGPSNNKKRRRSGVEEEEEEEKGNANKMTRNEYTEYNLDDICSIIFDYYTEIYIFHKINALITDNFIEENVMIENIIDNDNTKSGLIESNFLKEIYNNNILNKINDFYLNVLTPENFEKIQYLLNINHNFYTEADDEDINNDEILQKLNNKNVFNDTIDIEYEPDIVTSRYINSTLLYDFLNHYNSKLNIINNTYKEYYNEYQEGTVDVISIDNLNNVFEQNDINISNNFDIALNEAKNSIKKLLNIYSDMNTPQEGKVAVTQTIKKRPRISGLHPINNKIKKELFKYSNQNYMDVEQDDNSNLKSKYMDVEQDDEGKVSTSIVAVTGGKRKRNNKKTKKRIKKLNKTKKRLRQKNKKTSLPKSKRKTKKNKKKKRNKTKIKKGGKNKKKKKKQFFEMSIKELKKYVNKKSKK